MQNIIMIEQKEQNVYDRCNDVSVERQKKKKRKKKGIVVKEDTDTTKRKALELYDEKTDIIFESHSTTSTKTKKSKKTCSPKCYDREIDKLLIKQNKKKKKRINEDENSDMSKSKDLKLLEENADIILESHSSSFNKAKKGKKTCNPKCYDKEIDKLLMKQNKKKKRIIENENSDMSKSKDLKLLEENADIILESHSTSSNNAKKRKKTCSTKCCDEDQEDAKNIMKDKLLIEENDNSLPTENNIHMKKKKKKRKKINVDNRLEEPVIGQEGHVFNENDLTKGLIVTASVDIDKLEHHVEKGRKNKKKEKLKELDRLKTKNELSSQDSKSDEMDKKIIVSDKRGDGNEAIINDIHDQTSTSAKNSSEENLTDGFSPLHYITGGRRTREILNTLKRQGVIRRFGRWTPDEIQKLDENLRDFLSSHEVKDIEGLVMVRSKEDRVFRKKTNFLFKICKGIHRTAKEIDSRLTSQFSDFFKIKRGKLSENELSQLLSLKTLHGNDWKKIALLMNRNHNSLRRWYSRYRPEGWKMGPWDKTEDRALIQATNAFLKKGKVVRWNEVCKAVLNRSAKQCHKRWSTKYIREKTFNVNFKEEEIFQLISLIYESNVEDEYLIDWNNLSENFHYKFTPASLKWKFGVVCKEVPHSHMLEFGDVLEQLYDIYENKTGNYNENTETTRKSEPFSVDSSEDEIVSSEEESDTGLQCCII